MKRVEFTRLFRKLALTHHPDKGGDHDTFLKLAEAYQVMLKKNQRTIDRASPQWVAIHKAGY